MEYKFAITAFLLLFCLGGCETQQQADLTSRATLKSGGDYIGALPDGRKIYRYELDRANSSYNHYIYVVGNTISVNTSEKQGKNTVHRVTVMIDGVEYVPVGED